MKAAQRQEFSIKCECIITKNNIQINGKKKSKFSLISLNSQKKVLTCQPFGSQKQEETLVFPLAKLKAIHKKYIEEGKLTLQFLERSERLQLKGIDVANTDEVVEVISRILISSASKENLELLIKKIVAIKNTNNSEAKKNNNEPPAVKEHMKKRPLDMDEFDEKKGVTLSRKQLMSIAMNPQKPKIILPNKPKQFKIIFFDLPAGIINQIFQYCQMTLDMRVISRRFSEHILKNITSIKLADEVDDRSFNKLSKWAVEVECRMRNVKNLELMDKYEHQELIKGRAKTLKFGAWKQITSKNIMQLKGLRIFCLQIPYSIKFDLTNLFGVRMVELRLKSPQITNNRSEFVKTEDILYLIKTIKDLRVLELPYANSELLTLIEQPKKMTEIKIYYLSDSTKEEGWKDLRRFENLKIFSLWYVQKLGYQKQNHQITLKFSDNLTQLEIGHFISSESLQNLPISLQYLKLIGENYYNTHIQNMYLPNMKLLDITMSRNVKQDVLEFMKDISMVTYWSRSTVDFVSGYANSRGIHLTTKNPDFK